jgi:hypothetical protein
MLQALRRWRTWSDTVQLARVVRSKSHSVTIPVSYVLQVRTPDLPQQKGNIANVTLEQQVRMVQLAAKNAL